MQKNTVNHAVDTIIRRNSQSSSFTKSKSKELIKEVSKARKDAGSFYNINLSVNRSLKDFKEFKKQKSSKQNSSNEVVEYYNQVLDSLNEGLDFHFKKVPLSKANDELRDIETVVNFNGKSFEKKDQKQIVKGSILKVINSFNTLLDEEEFEISSCISDIEIKSSHKTDEILLIFSLKKEEVVSDNFDLKKVQSSLKTVVFRLRDLGNVISSAFIKKDGSFLKITGSDRVRESIADISIELKPESFFEKNPEQTLILCRRFEQLVESGVRIEDPSKVGSKIKNKDKGRNKNKSQNKDNLSSVKSNVLWDINCRYGLLTLAALRLGWKTFSVITDNSKSDDIYNNIDINKNISGSILDKKSEYIVSSLPSKILPPKDRTAPQVIVLKLIGEGFDLSQEFIHFLVNSMNQKKYSRLFLYTLSVDSLKTMTLKLKEYGIYLRQVEGTEIIPNNKNQICYLSIFSKSLKQE